MLVPMKGILTHRTLTARVSRPCGKETAWDTGILIPPVPMKKQIAAVLSIGVLMSLSACSSKPKTDAGNNASEPAAQNAAADTQDDNTADSAADDSGTTVTTGNGTFSDKNELPQGWPADVPQYPASTVQYSGTAQGTGMAAAFLSSRDIATVSTEYTQMIKDAGWDVKATMDSGNAKVISATKDTRTLSVYIGGDVGQTMITVGIETAK